MSSTTISSSPLRDDICQLLLELVETFDDDVDAHRASLRHFGIAGLNLATEADDELLLGAADALRWIGAFRRWCRAEASVDDVVDQLQGQRLLRRLDVDAVRRHLLRAERRPSFEQDNADDDSATPLIEGRTRALQKLFECDRRLDLYLESPPAERRDLLFDDPDTLVVALELYADEATRCPHGVDAILPDWDIDIPAQPLDILARFAASNFTSVPRELAHLGGRTRRFEQSLAEHLDRHGVLPAIYAALAFAPSSVSTPPSNRSIRLFLTGFSVFADDRALLDLAVALIDIRHQLIDHLVGRRPFADLGSWVDYLCGPCRGLIKSRGISEREAIHFAHYALHLVNICDLAADPGQPMSEKVRRASMQLEDELKELALAADDEAAATESDIDLSHYADTRWRHSPPRARLADRIARLGGAWRSGHRNSPPGSAPTTDDDSFDHLLELVTSDQDCPQLDAATHLVANARFRGITDGWSLDRLLHMVTASLVAARHAPSIDIESPFTVDLGAVTSWVTDGDDKTRRQEIIEPLIDDGFHRPASLLAGRQGLTTTTDEQLLCVDVSTCDELEALLTLLADCDDEDFAATLRRRLQARFDTSSGSDDTFDNTSRPARHLITNPRPH